MRQVTGDSMPEENLSKDCPRVKKGQRLFYHSAMICSHDCFLRNANPIWLSMLHRDYFQSIALYWKEAAWRLGRNGPGRQSGA